VEVSSPIPSSFTLHLKSSLLPTNETVLHTAMAALPTIGVLAAISSVSESRKPMQPSIRLDQTWVEDRRRNVVVKKVDRLT
jgi:hypothetical protein